MSIRRLKRHKPAAHAFQSELSLEIMKSDKLRVTILLYAFGLVLPAIMALSGRKLDGPGRVWAYHTNEIFRTVKGTTCQHVQQKQNGKAIWPKAGEI